MAELVLAIDPSSTRTGYALMTGTKRHELIDAGYLRGPAKGGADERIEAMVDEVVAIIRGADPDVVVIEVPSGRAGTASKRGAKSSLAIYGLAVGEIRRAAKNAMHDKRQSGVSAVYSVTERQWARGPKANRQHEIAAMYPMYEVESDRGGDVADAIGIGRWWLTTYRNYAMGPP